MNKLLLSIVLLFCCSANAQYAEYFKFNDVRHAAIYNINLQNVILGDIKILKENTVKEVTARDENGNILNNFLVNREGLITTYSTFEYNNGNEIRYDIDWDSNGKINKIKYIESGPFASNFLYSFIYKDYHLDYINVYFGSGLSEDYMFSPMKTAGETAVSKIDYIDYIDYKDKSKDTVYMTIDFNYDSNENMISTRQTGFEKALDTIYSDGSSITFEWKNVSKIKFTIDDNRISEEETTYPIKQHYARNYTKYTEEKDIVSTRKYFYKANGLIDYIQTATGNQKGKTNYEYKFYEN